MSFDGFVTRAVAHELENVLTGGKVVKVYQPSDTELLLHVRNRGRLHKLLLSAHPAYARVHLTENPTDNPSEPPMFCMLLRKHLEGGRVERIAQDGMERVLHIDIRSRDELGFETTRRLVAEIMGRHSNLILIDPDSGNVLDAIRRVGFGVSRHRQVYPGTGYTPPPPQNKKNPLEIGRDGFIASLDYNAGRLDKQMVERFSGLSPLLAKEILHRAPLGDREALWRTFSGFMAAAREHRYEPALFDTDGKQGYSVWPMTHTGGEIRRFESISECLDRFYFGKAERDRIRQQTQDLVRSLKSEIEKNVKKIHILKRELEEADKAEEYRVHGELLTSHLHLVKRGDTEARVINYYDPEGRELVIPLDPMLSPSENAQRFFKKYNKLKAAVKWNEEQIRKAEEDNAWLESVLVQLENASIRDLEEIREELEEEGWLKSQPRKQNRRKKDHPEPLSVRSSDGITIQIGRNNKQNDRLTHRLASPTDTWLHTKEIPGSHVVIRAREFPERTLLEAAMLAAWFSKARDSAQVPVDHTLVKHVKKPSGSRPGFVIYEKQRTLFVTPDPDMVRELLKRQPKG
ncbi:Rqc2 family fibronectin-binding protein [Staphylospora marina]|uniref:Rqc2 family fibronectin-binding protein n=1 Tax=Staphylospora marina TaxID=2490858 RepID=UPI000F5C0B61|nr:NFACT RNA binding domain-containing protein [Staphylospora marina]